MGFYVDFVKEYPILSGMIQFAILGPIGEYIATKIKGKKWSYGFVPTAMKSIGWAVLAIFIKYAFTGFVGFVDILVDHSMLPAAFLDVKFLNAFARSFFTNIMFGPLLFFLHRWWDNVIDRKNDYKGLPKAMVTLLWLWIPAHTVTFSLPTHFQMGLAALWSLVLGVILGFFITQDKPAQGKAAQGKSTKGKKK